MKFFPTTATNTNDNYPYGRLRCTKVFGLEFNPKRGFRTVGTTTNPKTGRVNKPKKSTYHEFILMVENGEGHTKYQYNSFNDDANEVCTWLGRHWELFTEEEKKYAYVRALGHVKISLYGIVNWGGASSNDAINLYDPTLKALVEALKTPTVNSWGNIVFPTEEQKSAIKPADFNPFK